MKIVTFYEYMIKYRNSYSDQLDPIIIKLNERISYFIDRRCLLTCMTTEIDTRQRDNDFELNKKIQKHHLSQRNSVKKYVYGFV